MKMLCHLLWEQDTKHTLAQLREWAMPAPDPKRHQRPSSRGEASTWMFADNFQPITDTEFKMHSSNLINSTARNMLL